MPRIPIFVCPLNQRAETVMNALHHPVFGLDIETAAGANRDAAEVDARFFARSDDGLDQISGLEPEGVFAPPEVTTRKTKSVQPRALVATPSGGRDT
ncbi:MAG: hypothetical protein OWR62_16795, partial [Sulfobacillus thermotolerans]|nr:hypothetical protein [Sulfobacillus thermotolerans]